MKPNDQITIGSIGHEDPLALKKYGLDAARIGPLVAVNSELKWKDVLEAARKRPQMYVGELSLAHLKAIEGAVAFLKIARPFQSPFAANIVFSPTQYIVRCTTGRLRKDVEQTVDWNTERMLIDLLDESRFCRTGGTSLRSGTHPVYLAEKFFVGIASPLGFRHQTYRNGWPTTETLLLDENSPYTFVVAAQLTSEWFTGLPFTLKDVENFIAEYSSVRITCEMRPSDDILPEKDENMAELCS